MSSPSRATDPAAHQKRTRIDVRTHPASTGLSVGSLFSGIGGLELGLERAGMEVAWQVEIDPFCREVLARHWPDVPCYGDITELDPEELEPVDVICGGFPCQDISQAGLKAGIEGERSGLWVEFARTIRTLRPRYVVVENVPDLLARGLGTVLGDLAALGYDAEWDCVPAAAVGAPIGGHGRDRVFIVAYPNSDGLERQGLPRSARGELVARLAWGRGPVARIPGAVSDQWDVEPDVGRVADGVPDRVDRLRAVGNAVVPQIAEWIGRLIVADAERQEVAA